MQNIKKALACIFIFVGGMGLPTSLLSLLNPFGAKLYDADDPLGSPVTSNESMLAICIYALLLVTGIWMAVTVRRDNGTNQTQKELR
jgi:hypothetical protein